ncbi:MAG: molybdenum cofactor guanylyltransferase [Verrucomicrobia bacterium]|nr:molybdenum cofactor guanylyltransferase [Verrucomicrobiota bacterium]
MKTRDLTLFILAGGLSTRMGRDKARLRLGGRTLLGWIRERIAPMGVTVRVIRRDIVPRCGPLGGIVTGLARCRTTRAVFLSCDMPLVDARLLRRLMRAAGDAPAACFRRGGEIEPFPLLIRREMLDDIRARIRRRELAVHRLPLRRFPVSHAEHRRWFLNVNTPSEFAALKRQLG